MRRKLSMVYKNAALQLQITEIQEDQDAIYGVTDSASVL